MFSNEKRIAQVLSGFGIEPDEFIKAHEWLLKNKQDFIPVPRGGIAGSIGRLVGYAKVVRQITLHRSLFLFEGTIQALQSKNAYSMALNIRGHFEATAALGYLHRRIDSLNKGNITAVDLDRDIRSQIMGSRDQGIKERCEEQGIEAKQVMSLLDHADKSVSVLFLGRKPGEDKVLRESYEYLCEFAHPNFHSNALAFRLNKNLGGFEFCYEEPKTDGCIELAGYLILSAIPFIELYENADSLFSALENKE